MMPSSGKYIADMKVKDITCCFHCRETFHHIVLKKKKKSLVLKLCTFQGAWFLCDADLSLWDDRLTLGVANVSWDERQAGPLFFLRARVVQRQ